MKPPRLIQTLLLLMIALQLIASTRADDPWVVYDGKKGPGKDRHIVLISGDEEYRSEEALPQLGRILAKHHGFKCTVLFSIDAETGVINPNNQNNIPGLDALKTADLMVLFLRFRNPPDDQMKLIVDYIEAGKPIVAIRTSTHAFQIPKDRKYAKYDWRHAGEEYEQGFGRQVLGETWFSHHGWHRYQATRGLIAPGAKGHPILRGIKDGSIFGPTDVYGVRLPLPGDSRPLVLGQVLSGMKQDDKPLPPGPHYKSKETVNQNDPMMPIAWTKTHQGGRVFASTIGASLDLLNESVRRLLVNGCYWAAGLENKIPTKSNVDIVGEFKPTMFEFIRTKNYWPDKGMKPSNFKMSW